MTLREMSTPLARVQAILPLLAKIRKITCSASISWGVIHEGEVLLTHTEGLRDVEQGLEADINTAYLLASLTKGFISALCGILVEEEILEWDAPISDYVPLQWKIDPEAGRRVTLRDVLSHSTGRAHMDLTWLGVESETIVEKRDLLQVIGHLPMKFDLRGGFHYNNYMYALAGRIVEGACSTACGNEEEEEKTWPQELRHRIFAPLGMRTTATNREDLHTSNLAEGHVVLDDKSLKKIAPTDMSDRTAIGGAGSVWSTVPDMLKWAKELLEALDSNGKKAETILRQIETIFSPKIPIEHSAQENTYAMGWIRALLPSKGLGFISHNGLQRDHVLGENSRPRQVYYHNGGQSGYLSAFYLFPETKTAIVAMANSYGLGDAPDWTAHVIAEALFDLQPKRDYVSLATARAEYQYNFYSSLKEEYERNRQGSSSMTSPDDFLGIFQNDGLLMTLKVSKEPRQLESDPPPLQLMVNGSQTQQHRLHPYHFDMLGFLPSSREEMQLREYIDWRYWEQFVLRFQRDASGTVVSLLWRLQEGIDPILFTKSKA